MRFRDEYINQLMVIAMVGGAVLAVIAVLSIIYPDAGRAGAGAYEQAVVERVVDGDTLSVHVGLRSHKVRLIGIDAPESVSPDAGKNTAAGEAAAEELGRLCPPGTTVWLEKDKTDMDRYGRLLRYVYLSEPASMPADSEEYYAWAEDRMLNALMVASGHAKPRRYPPDTAHADFLESLSAGLPVWMAGAGADTSLPPTLTFLTA